jgi:hypothetical protein
VYATQARFAVAQLYDRANLAAATPTSSRGATMRAMIALRRC